MGRGRGPRRGVQGRGRGGNRGKRDRRNEDIGSGEENNLEEFPALGGDQTERGRNDDGRGRGQDSGRGRGSGRGQDRGSGRGGNVRGRPRGRADHRGMSRRGRDDWDGRKQQRVREERTDEGHTWGDQVEQNGRDYDREQEDSREGAVIPMDAFGEGGEKTKRDKVEFQGKESRTRGNGGRAKRNVEVDATDDTQRKEDRIENRVETNDRRSERKEEREPRKTKAPER